MFTTIQTWKRNYDLSYLLLLHWLSENDQDHKIFKRKMVNIKRQYHKMVKHTQTIRRQIGDKLFKCVWPFFGIGA